MGHVRLSDQSLKRYSILIVQIVFFRIRRTFLQSFLFSHKLLGKINLAHIFLVIFQKQVIALTIESTSLCWCQILIICVEFLAVKLLGGIVFLIIALTRYFFVQLILAYLIEKIFAGRILSIDFPKNEFMASL